MSLEKLRSHEVIRKVIHLSSSLLPLAYWFLFEREVILQIVIFLAVGFLLAEFLRLRSSSVEKIFMSVFGSALRRHEKEKLTGATYVFTGSVLAIFLFPKEIAVAALLILSISDTLAALVGIPFGKHKFFEKSVEGSLTFFISTWVILSIFFPSASILNIIISGIVTLAEANPMNLDDNFLIPILSGVLLSIASVI